MGDSSLVIYFDGACEPRNPGGVGTFGFVIYHGAEKIHEGFGIACEPGPNCTNNVAEYIGLVSALEWLLDHGHHGSRVTIRGDSQLVIRQLSGAYSVRSPRLRPLVERALGLLGHFDYRLEWVPRELNREADELSKRAYIEYLDQHPELLEGLRPYFATERQLGFLRRLGVEPHRYMSKVEASRLIRSLLRRRRWPRGQGVGGP